MYSNFNYIDKNKNIIGSFHQNDNPSQGNILSIMTKQIVFLQEIIIYMKCFIDLA